MATTITGKLNKPATQFQAGDSTGFGIRLGVKFYDRETKADAYTNFECVVFAKAPAQVQFYQSALVEGAVVEVTGDKLKIRQFQGSNGLSLSIELLDAKLGFVHAPQSAQQRPAPQQPQQRQQPQQSFNQPRQAPPQGYQGQMPQNRQPGQSNSQGYMADGRAAGAPMEPPIDFDDDIPFN